MKMKHKAIFSFLLLLLSLSLAAQNKVAVKGVVYDNLKMTLPGVSVLEVGTTNGTITDLDGNFALDVNSNATLRISYIGYVPIEVKATTGAPMRITMKEDSQQLEEVVVTGYSGTQLRSKSTNSIAKVANEKLTVGAYSNPAQALSGAVSGLRVQQTSGNPGSTPTMVLRGVTNLDGSGSPLVIVDGQVRASLSDINPEDIQDLQVMKDAGATAIYGARANNGVIMVTTKKGKSGHSELNFKAKVGLNYLNNPYEFANSEEYLYWMRTAYSRSSNMWQDGTKHVGYVSSASLSGAQPYGTGNTYNPTSGIWSTMELSDANKGLLDLNQGWKTMTDPITGKELIFMDTDVASYNINTPSLTQDYNVNMSGGNDKGSYYAGLGYNYSEGLPVSSFYKRYSFVFNGDYKIKDWIQSISSFNFNRANWESMPASQTSEYNYFGRILSMPPTVRYVDENGNMMMGNSWGDGNQLYQPDQFLRDNQTDKFTMNQAFQFNIAEGLKFRVAGNWYYSEGLRESFNKDYYTNPTTLNKTRSSSASYDRTFDQTYNAVLNYSKQITADHYLDAMLGTEYYDSYYNYFYAAGEGAATDDFQDLGLTSTKENKRTIDSSHSRQRILSFFGRLNYDYKSKYLLSLVMRRDGYSKLLDNRWGVFPGVSAGWVFSKEGFMKDYTDIISFAKLRTSYGMNGNVSGIGNYTLQGAYATSTNYNGNSSYVISSIPNPTLRWEKTKTWEFGLDLSFLENRYSTNFTYYDRLTDGKYAAASLPVSSGISSITTNNGQFRNRGVEIDVTAKVIQGKDWNWTLGANISYNKNTVVTLPNNGLERNRQNAFQISTGRKDDQGNDILEWVGGYQEGQEPGILYAYQADGIYKSWDEIPDYLVDKGGGSSACILYGKKSWAELEGAKWTGSDSEVGASKTKKLPIQPGDVKWKDVNGDGIIDSYDRVKVGNTTPHWIGGFNSTLQWKGFQFYAALDYGFGYKIFDNTSSWFLGCMQGAYNMTTDVKKTWSEENPNGTLPKYYWADQLGKSNYYRTSSMFAYDGAYLAFRELSLSYSLPKSLANKIKLEKVDLSVTGQNLGYLTQCKSVATPEAGSGAGSGYALPRTLLFGINLTF